MDYLPGRTENPNSHKDLSSNIVSNNKEIHGSIVNNSHIPTEIIRTNNNDSLLSREETELVRIYRRLDIRYGHKLLDCAFNLEQEKAEKETK